MNSSARFMYTVQLYRYSALTAVSCMTVPCTYARARGRNFIFAMGFRRGCLRRPRLRTAITKAMRRRLLLLLLLPALAGRCGGVESPPSGGDGGDDAGEAQVRQGTAFKRSQCRDSASRSQIVKIACNQWKHIVFDD